MKFSLVLLIALFAFINAQALCSPCQLGVNLVKQYISKPDDELLQMLLSQCEKLPSNLQAPCKMAITLVGKQMIEYIRSHVREEPRAICARFRLCSNELEVAEEQDGPLCGPCQLGVNLVKEYISKPDDELLSMLLKGCESLPSDLQAPCKMAVTLVGKQMLEFIRGNLRESPRVICARFRLCAPAQTEEEKNKIQCVLRCLGSGWNVQRVLKLLAKCKTDKKCYVKELGEHAANCVFGCLAEEKQQDTPLCAPCQLGIQLVKDYVSKPDDELLSMLLKGCESLPSDLQAPCKMAVTLVGKQMLEFVRGNFREEPRTICARFRMCSTSEEVAQIEPASEEKNKVKCVLKCLGSGWNIPRVLKLLAKCKVNKACYIKEVGQRAAECIAKCL